MLRCRLLLACLLATPVACTDEGATTSPPDATSDVGADVVTSDVVTADVANDTSADVLDGGHDALSDSGSDTEADVAADAPEDAVADVQNDVDPSDVWVELGAGVWVRPGRPVPGDSLQIRYGGTLVTAPAVTVHFGFNGWNEVPGTGAIGEDDGSSNLDFAIDAALAKQGAEHVGEVVVPPGARAVHMVFRAFIGASEQWDNNAGRDYNIGVRFPYLGPFITWHPSAPPTQRLDVHFHTGMQCDAYVEYGDGALTDTALGGAGRMHHIALTGLQPDRQYLYRVGCDGHAPSETFTFRTASSSTAVQFAVASDAQDNGETGRWAQVADSIRSHDPKPSFLVFAGDLAWNDKPGLWWTFFDAGHQLLRETPMAAVPGNHDTPGYGSSPDTSSFSWLFGLDGSPGSLTRSLRWGPAQLVLLNSEDQAGFAAGAGPQEQWCAQALGMPSIAPWVFVAMHAPPYNAGVRHIGEQGHFRDLTQLFDGSVDWVFTGHEHLYQRMKPMRYNGVIAPSGAYGRGNDDGVGYMIAPPAGAWPNSEVVAWNDPKAHYRDRLAYPIPDTQLSTVPSEQGFVFVAIDGEQVVLRSYGVGVPGSPASAHVVDEVSYTRP